MPLNWTPKPAQEAEGVGRPTPAKTFQSLGPYWLRARLTDCIHLAVMFDSTDQQCFRLGNVLQLTTQQAISNYVGDALGRRESELPAYLSHRATGQQHRRA